MNKKQRNLSLGDRSKTQDQMFGCACGWFRECVFFFFFSEKELGVKPRGKRDDGSVLNRVI